MAKDNQNPKVFISYRRQISDVYAGRLYDRIIHRFGDDMKVFMDIDSIGPGDDFVKVIETAVANCNILVAVIGKDWATVSDSKGNRRLDNPEDFVRIEIAAALKRDIRVIPVLVQGAEMPSADELPDDLKALPRRNAVSINNDRWNDDANRVIKAIEQELNIQRDDSSSGQNTSGTRLESENLRNEKEWSWYEEVMRHPFLTAFGAITTLVLIAALALITGLYISRNYLRSSNNLNTNVIPESTENSTTPTPAPSNYPTIVLRNDAKLYSSTSTASNLKGTVLKDSRVKILSSDGNWRGIEVVEPAPDSKITAGDTGYIYYAVEENPKTKKNSNSNNTPQTNGQPTPQTNGQSVPQTNVSPPLGNRSSPVNNVFNANKQPDNRPKKNTANRP